MSGALTIKALSEALDAVESGVRSVVERERGLAQLLEIECESSQTGGAPRCGPCLRVQAESEAHLGLARDRLRDARGRLFALVADSGAVVAKESA